MAKIVPYIPQGAPEVDGVTILYLKKEFGNIANSIKSMIGAWTNPSAQTGVVTVATLPAASANKGARYMVSDATVTTFWSVVAGGGTNIVPVTSDGTAWRIG